jgi:hypothetical protein
VVQISEYEQQVLRDVDAHRRKQLERSPRRLVPEQIRSAAQRGGETIKKAPGAEHVADAYRRAAGGLSKVFSKAGQTTISPDRILAAYQRRGHQVETLQQVRGLDLEIVERKVRRRRMDIAYGAVAFVEGAVAGGVITGGEALFGAGTVLGAGAGGAPGLGTVTGTIAADTAFTLTLMNRAIAHTALYYGYDTAEPAEAIFAMSVLGLGTATTSSAKLAAYQELSKLTQMLARRATWKQLNEHALPVIAAKVATRFGFKITQRKLGTLVPIAGVVVGASLNYQLLDSITDAAYWAYRERFIRDKTGDFDLGLATAEPTAHPAVDETGTVEQPMDVITIVEETLAERPDGDTHPQELEGPEDPSRS